MGVLNGENKGAGFWGGETRYDGHICGNCRWENKGREDCPNNRPPQEADDDAA